MDHGRITPSRIEASTSPITKSASTAIFVPKPEHSWHAPKGALNENVLGSISVIASAWSFGHDICSEKLRFESLPLRSTKSIVTLPPASFRAVSIESVSLPVIPALIARRSTTTAMSCLYDFFSGLASAKEIVSPSTIARA